MRRREKYANDTKIADPVAYQTSHDPLASFAKPVEVSLESVESAIKSISEGGQETIEAALKGVCQKCGKRVGKGIAMHTRHCHGE